jgi:hypothetical protein
MSKAETAKNKITRSYSKKIEMVDRKPTRMGPE